MTNLEATNICKNYFHPQKLDVLKGVSLKVEESTSIAIMGASGEGKTTFLHILGLLEKPDKGFIKINSEKVDSKNAARLRNENLGFVFQDYNLLEDFSILDNVVFPAKIARADSKKSILRAEKYLEIVGLSNRKNSSAKYLSGGEKQRVAIARAFCNNPKVILADEPSGSLDSKNSKIIHDLLISTTKNEKKSLLIATHDLKLAALCDKSYELKDGLLIPL